MTAATSASSGARSGVAGLHESQIWRTARATWSMNSLSFGVSSHLVEIPLGLFVVGLAFGGVLTYFFATGMICISHE